MPFDPNSQPIVELRRAIQQSDISAVLVKKELDPIITRLVEYNNPLRVNLTRKPGSGAGYYLNSRTPGTTPAAFINDTESLTEQTGTYAQEFFEHKTFGTQGKITRKAQKIAASYKNILQDELEAKAEEFRDFEEWAIIWGSKTNPKEFDGLHKLAGTVYAVTVGTSGARMTAEQLDEAIDKVRGMPNMIICSKRTRRQMWAILATKQSFVNQVEVRGGFKLTTYSDVPIYVNSRIPDTCTFDGTKVTAATGGATSVMYILDNAKVFLSVLTDIEVIPLDKVSSQYDAFDMVCDEVLVVRDPVAVVEVVGIGV
jgi:hypothetical protein